MPFTKKDIDNVIERYTKRYNEFGYSPKSLGWDKGKQDIRFDILSSLYNFENKHILDIGCGFGDFIKTISKKTKDYKYTGIDIVESLIFEANKQFKGENINFINKNILDFETNTVYDYAISSGIFNHKISENNNYEFIELVIKKTLSICKDGLAFDFLSDKVDFQLEHTFHSSPEKILSIAYKYSRNVVLRNDYMPFEFSIFIFKDDSFQKEDTVFNLFKLKK
jgi:SAM-dependent methyltransferase